MTRRRDAGFTLIETMIVLCIISVLVRIAVPAYSAMRRDSYATHALGDVNAIRAGMAAEYAATGSYAPDAADGVIPPAMAPYLPRDFSFSRPQYSIDWENDAVADTTAGGSGASGQVLAVTVTAKDPALGLTILHTLGANCTHWSVGDAHTFVLQSTLEASR